MLFKTTKFAANDKKQKVEKEHKKRKKGKARLFPTFKSETKTGCASGVTLRRGLFICLIYEFGRKEMLTYLHNVSSLEFIRGKVSKYRSNPLGRNINFAEDLAPFNRRFIL